MILTFLRNTLRAALGELNEMVHDAGILIFVVFVPLAYPLLYSYVYTNEVVREISCAVVDDSHSQLSREYVRKLDATPETDVAYRCADMAEARRLMEERKVYGVLHIPAEFGRDLANAEQAYIGLYCDMSSMLYYKGLMLAAKNVSLDINRDLKVERYVTATTRRQEEVNRMPVDYDYVPLFNRQSGFAAFLIPPVLMLIIQQTLLLGIGMSRGREREKGKHFTISRFHNSMVNRRCSMLKVQCSTVIGKALPYLVLYTIMGIYMVTYVMRSFALPQVGEFHAALCLLLPYLLSCIFLAQALSAMVYRREDCILMYVCLSVPLLFMSGISWPTCSMPTVWRYVAWLFPSTFGMNAYTKITTMGATAADINSELTGLWVQAAVYFALACLSLRSHTARHTLRSTVSPST